MSELNPGVDVDETVQDDQDMAEWEELDQQVRQGNTIEVEYGSDDDDVPVDSGSDGGDGAQFDDDEEIGVVDDKDIYSDDEGPYTDDAVALAAAHEDSVLSIAVCPSDRQIMVTGGQDDSAIIWNISQSANGVKCTERCRLRGHTDSVVQVAFSHDGRYLATGSYDGSVRIWAPDSGTLVHALEGPSKEVEWILWHPKGHAILAGSNDTMVWMWWAPTGKLMQIFAGHAQSVTCGCWGLGGKLICSGSEDRSVIVWNPRSGTPQQHARQLHEGAIISLCAHPEAPIVVTGSDDAVARVVQMETGKVIANLSGHTDSVECVLFSNPGADGVVLLATASMDGKVNVWDGKTFSFRCALKEHEERGGVVKFKWLPAPAYGSWLCTCANDSTLRLFNALSGECIRTLKGHEDTVLDLDLWLFGDPGNEQLCVVSGSDDNSSRIFIVALFTGGSQQIPGTSAGGQAVAPTSSWSPGSKPSPGAMEAGMVQGQLNFQPADRLAAAVGTAPPTDQAATSAGAGPPATVIGQPAGVEPQTPPQTPSNLPV